MRKKGFLKRNEIFEAKKGFPFVSLRSEKNLSWSEAKRSEKMDLNFLSEQAKHMQNGSNCAFFCL